jgi:oligoendopeptidase F
MTLADIYAPMQHDAPAISWDNAKQIVLDSFQQFDDQFYAYAKDMFDSNRVDVFPSKVKRGGAFCSSSRPEIRPYVMLNYLGKQRDVATLAHELGHAIHAYFSSNQPLVNYHAILPVCETASVFCEMLVVDALKKSATSKQEKMVLLATKLEDIFATSHRQNMFSCFEQKIHDKMSSSRLSSSELCEIYAQGLKDMFGDSVDIPMEYHWEWATIPHMLDVPFYVYSYNFGNLLVLGLYQLYLHEGQAFIPKLKRILSAGSSKSPVELMRDEGIDILSSDFWQGSISYIESILNELQLTLSMD